MIIRKQHVNMKSDIGTGLWQSCLGWPKFARNQVLAETRPIFVQILQKFNMFW